jgi:integrase
MLDRDNWQNIRKYLSYRRDVDLISSASLRLEDTWLSHVLTWAGSRSFRDVIFFRPTFPQYLRSQNYSAIYTAHIVRSSRRFFLWLSKHQRGFSSITPAWLDTLKVPQIIEDKTHRFVTLEYVRSIASAPVYSLRDTRVRAAAVFWFLSGIRIGAFVSLPVSAVDLNSLSVRQYPSLGVRTKFKKKALTFLLNVPDLLPVVRDWDNIVRSAGSRFWFAPCSPDTGLIDPSISAVGINRHHRARKDFQNWLSRVNLPYFSPHAFRHGHAVYAIKNALTVSALKAISQNLMHSSLKVTDSTYAILDDLDVQNEINSLGNSPQQSDDIINKIRDLLSR